MQKQIACLFVFVIISTISFSQDSTVLSNRLPDIPNRVFDKMTDKSTGLDDKLTRKTEKYLRKLARQERRIKNKLSKIDSGFAKQFFEADPSQLYESLSKKISNNSVSSGIYSGEYLPYMDSLKNSLSFLGNNLDLLNNSKLKAGRIQQSLQSFTQLETKMQKAEEVKQFLQQRKEQLRNYLAHYTHLPAGIAKSYSNYTKQLYYYNEQVKEYKQMLNDPDKALKEMLSLLNRLPIFRDFMKKNSLLAGLFGSPGNYNTQSPVDGLQARDKINYFIQAKLSDTKSGASSIMQKNIQAALGQVDELRNKISGAGGSGADLSMPDFKPNNQKTKSWLDRLEYGTNLQTTKSTYFFPVTTDLGLTVGYKLNDKNIVGIGASYKVGWGKDFSHIAISSQGVGFRSFLDIHVKNSFFASGGFEYNYQQPFASLTSLKDPDKWQESGLLGASKIISLKTKFFKKTKIQLLWDFLSYNKVPLSQPFKFRVGYNF